MKREFFLSVVVSVLQNSFSFFSNKTLGEKARWELGNYKRMLHAILNKSWKQHPTKQQLYDHLPLILQTIQVRQIRHVEHYWISRNKLKLTFSYGLLHIDTPVLADQRKLIFISSVQIPDVSWSTLLHPLLWVKNLQKTVSCVWH